MLDAMERGELTTLYCLGENPADSEADRHRALKLLGGLEFMVVQDLFYTKTAELADVVLPATAGWCESEGTVTSSERRVQRVRAAVPAARACATISRSSLILPAVWDTTGASRKQNASGTNSVRSVP